LAVLGGNFQRAYDHLQIVNNILSKVSRTKCKHCNPTGEGILIEDDGYTKLDVVNTENVELVCGPVATPSVSPPISTGGNLTSLNDLYFSLIKISEKYKQNGLDLNEIMRR